MLRGMNLIVAAATSLTLAASLAAGAAVYRAQADQPVTVWAPCPVGSQAEGDTCVLERVQVVPTPAGPPADGRPAERGTTGRDQRCDDDHERDGACRADHDEHDDDEHDDDD